MFWHHWRKYFDQLLARRGEQRRRSRRRQASFRPWLESLEQRQMLAVDLQLGAATINENAGTTALIAILDTPATASVTVTVTPSGTATFGGANGDYNFNGSTASPLTITILNGSSTGSVSITSLNDSVFEGNETVQLTISDVVGYGGATTGTTQSVSLTITDDETPPLVSIAFSSPTVDESGSSIALVATLSGPAAVATTVELDSPGGTATDGLDFSSPVPFQVTIPAGATSASVSFTISNDTLDENDETYTASILTITPGTISASSNSISSFTILDDDLPPLANLSLSTTTISENSGSATVLVTLSEASGRDITVNLNFTGSATLGGDYSASTTSFFFPAGQTSQAITLTAIQDGVFESNESVIVTLSSIDTDIGASSSGTVTLVDDEVAPSVTLLAPSPNSVHESGSSTTLVAQLSHLSTTPVTVNFSFTGSATQGTDYSVSTTSITIPAGQSTGSITLVGVADAAPLFEGNESIIAEIASVTGGSENGTQSQAITVTDQDAAPVLNFSFSANTMSEVGGVVTMSATITGPLTAQDIVFPFTLGGTASSGSDYTTTPGFAGTASGTITIPAGQTSGTVVFTSLNDNTDEGVSESIGITLGLIPGNATYTGSPTFAIAQIDDDATPEVELSIGQTSIGEDGGVAQLVATINRPSSQPVVVNLGLTGTANSTSDYSLSANTITIPAGSLSASIALTALFDFAIEGNETVVVDITSIDNGAATEAIQQTVSVPIEDLPVTLSRIGSGSIVENSTGTTTLVATLGSARAVDTTVSLTLTGTATNNTDYSLSSTSIVVLAGQTTGSVTLTALSDTIDENPDETVTASITVPGGANSASQTVTFAIADDDATPALNLSVNQTSISENGGVAIVTATLSNPSSQTITASLTFGGTAIGSDYNASTTSFTFAPGATSASLSLTGVADVTVEGNETVIVSLNQLSSGVTAGATTTLQTTLTEAAVPTVSLSRLGSGNMAESGSETIVATLSGTVSQNVTVTLGFTGTAQTGSDYTPSTTSITILSGQSTGSVVITGSNDTRDDDDTESVIVDILTVGPVGVATENGTQSITFDIADDDLSPSVTGFTINPTTLSEAGGTALAVATISAISDRAVTITLAASGSAASGSDYSLSANTIVIPAGQTTAAITIAALTDFVNDPNETIILDVASVTNGTETGNQLASATISDVQLPGVTLTVVGSNPATESNSTTIRATLSQTSSQAITINLGATGTATSGSDYTLSSTSILIPAGSLSGTVLFTGVADNLDEADQETVTLSIASIVPVNGAAASNPATVTFNLVDNDAFPQIAYSASTTSFTENGGSSIVVARLAQASGRDVTVTASIQSGTATSNSDYSLSAFSILIPAGQLSGSLSITAINDSVDEDDETATIRLNSPITAASTPELLTFTILDEDPGPNISLSLSSTTLSEQNGTVRIIAVADVASSRSIIIPVVLGGTATAGTDFTPQTGSITIAAGQISAALTLTGVNDNVPESNETISVSFATSSSYQLVSGASSGSITMLDDGNGVNTVVNFSTATQSATETSGTRSIVVTLSAARGTDTTVSLTLAGSATNGSDYSLSTTSVVIPANQLSASVGVAILTDNVVENDETVVVTFNNLSGVTAGATSTQTITIAGHIQRSGSTVNVVGTAGNDTLDLVSSNDNTFRITLRGPGGETISQTFTAGDVTLVNYDALGGNDTSTLTGSSHSESVTLTGTTFNYSRSQLSIATTNSERNTFNGGSGDSALFNDSTGSDTFYGFATSAQMQGQGGSYLNAVNATPSVTADAGAVTGDTDTVVFSDQGAGDSSNDTFTGSITSSTYVLGNANRITANRFASVNVFSGGGLDTATVSGSAGNEVYYGLPTYGVMVYSGSTTTLVGLDEVTMNGGSGTDQVLILGSTGNDTVSGSGATIVASGTGYKHTASDFDAYYAFDGGGGTDTATWNDSSSGNDTFYGLADAAYLIGTGNTGNLFAGGYSSVIVTASGGTDTAYLYDSAGNDTFTGSSATSVLVTSLNRYEVSLFDSVFVLMAGGTDSATLNDSSGNDTLAGTVDNLLLSGAAYSINVLRADSIEVNATSGGTDTASVGDSIGSDRLFAIGSRFQIRTPAALARLNGFDRITANSRLGGFDLGTVGATDYALALTGNWLPG